MRARKWSVFLAAMALSAWGSGSAGAADAGRYSLDEVVVEADKDILAGGYMSEKTGLGMAGKKDAMEMPFTAMTLTEKTIRDFAMPNHDEMMDILSFSPSVRKTTSRDLVAMRGIQTKAEYMTLNGIPGMYGAFSLGTNYIESVDIVSGPAVNYTGSATQNVVGGTVGFTTKRAKDTPVKNFGISFMSDGNFRETLDWGQRFADGAWGVRVNAMYGDGDLAVHGESLCQKNISVNIDHKSVDSESNFFAGYAYSKHNGGNAIFQTIGSNPSASTLAGIPYIPAAPDGKYNMLPSWAYGEKRMHVMTFNHTQKINEHWNAFLNAGIMKYEVPISMEPNAMTSVLTGHFSGGVYDGLFDRKISVSASGRTQRYIGAGLTSNYDFGFMKNEFLIAVDRNSATNRSAASSKTLTLSTGNLYGDNDWEYQPFTKPGTYTSSKYTTKGYTILDTMKFLDEKLIISAGIHRHSYEARSFDKTGKVSSRDSYSGNSPTYGVLYRFTDNISAYYNHTETFLGGTTVPTGRGYKNEGAILDSSETKSNEIGVKVKTGNFLHTLSFYRAKVPTTATDAADNMVIVDGTKYEGVDFSTAGSLSDKWDIMASVGYNRWLWQNYSTPAWNGKLADGIPKWNANLALVYHANERLDVLGRMSYIGSSKIGMDNQGNTHYKIPSYTRFDLGVKYKTKISGTPVTFSAMCYNVTNKKGWFTADRGNQLYTADPRSFVLSTDMSF